MSQTTGPLRPRGGRPPVPVAWSILRSSKSSSGKNRSMRIWQAAHSRSKSTITSALGPLIKMCDSKLWEVSLTLALQTEQCLIVDFSTVSLIFINSRISLWRFANLLLSFSAMDSVKDHEGFPVLPLTNQHQHKLGKILFTLHWSAGAHSRSTSKLFLACGPFYKNVRK